MRQQVMRRWHWLTLTVVLATLGMAPLRVHAQTPDSPLQVVAAEPELGSLAREVGGNRVVVTGLVKGTEDPHFVEAKPSFIKALSQADVYIQAGLELEIGWVSTLLQQARNANVLPGAPGYVDASTAIEPLEVPTGVVDRSMGDVHPFGNPHYFLDPIQGLKVARLLRDRLSALRPASRSYFEAQYAAFVQRLGTVLVGEALAKKYDVEKLALLLEHGRLQDFLQSQGEATLLGGWLGRMAPYAGTKVVADHNIWPYFARRFGINVIGVMEPKPGVPPTTQHLQGLIKTMQAQGVRLILASAYYDPRHARFLAQNTGARVVEMANQAGARAGTDDYLRMVDYNVRQFVTALGGA
jgi:ABC-type Zn uptake system ZnuABC Zn-binding protein ZnuA